MKSFAQWVGDMANSIEDTSTIIKDENGVVLPIPKEKIYSDIYDEWAERMEDPYYEEDY